MTGWEASVVCPLYSRVVEHTPATVRIARAQALAAALVLTTGLHGHSGELQQKVRDENGQVWQNTQHPPEQVLSIPCVCHSPSQTLQRDQSVGHPKPRGLSDWPGGGVPHQQPRRTAAYDFLGSLLGYNLHGVHAEVTRAIYCKVYNLPIPNSQNPSVNTHPLCLLPLSAVKVNAQLSPLLPSVPSRPASTGPPLPGSFIQDRALLCLPWP